MSKLVLHSGALNATLDEVREIPTPAPEGRWHPVPHALLVDTVKDSLTQRGLDVVEEHFGLTTDGLRMFGTLDLAAATEADYRLVVGVRNSHDKAFAASLAMGSRVFICDNLAFSGEVQIARKHTRFIGRDLSGLVARATGKLGALRVRQDERIAAYKHTYLTDADAHDFVVRAVDARIVANAKIPAVLEQWRHPQAVEFGERTLWSLFNAYTEVLKESNQFGLPHATEKLHGLADTVAGLILPPSEN